MKIKKTFPLGLALLLWMVPTGMLSASSIEEGQFPNEVQVVRHFESVVLQAQAALDACERREGIRPISSTQPDPCASERQELAVAKGSHGTVARAAVAATGTPMSALTAMTIPQATALQRTREGDSLGAIASTAASTSASTGFDTTTLFSNLPTSTGASSSYTGGSTGSSANTSSYQTVIPIAGSSSANNDRPFMSAPEGAIQISPGAELPWGARVIKTEERTVTNSDGSITKKKRTIYSFQDKDKKNELLDEKADMESRKRAQERALDSEQKRANLDQTFAMQQQAGNSASQGIMMMAGMMKGEMKFYLMAYYIMMEAKREKQQELDRMVIEGNMRDNLDKQEEILAEIDSYDLELAKLQRQISQTPEESYAFMDEEEEIIGATALAAGGGGVVLSETAATAPGVSATGGATGDAGALTTDPNCDEIPNGTGGSLEVIAAVTQSLGVIGKGPGGAGVVVGDVFSATGSRSNVISGPSSSSGGAPTTGVITSTPAISSRYFE